MENREERARGSNWNHAHTMALAELKREAFLNNEHGPLVWERIAQTFSSRFPDQIRTGDQCRRRWDTLAKVYKHIEDYCVVTGAQDHRELDEGELASMELATAYHQDWYDIVEQVCSQRKRKERCDRDLMPAKRSKGSHSVEHPEHHPNRDTLGSASTSKSITYHEQSTPESTSTYAQVSSSSSLEADKLGPETDVPRLKNGNDGLVLEQSTTAHAQVSSSPSLVLEATQLRQHGQVSHEVSQEPQTLESDNLPPHTFPADNSIQFEIPLQQDLWDLLEVPSFGTLFEIELPDTESELLDPWYLDFNIFGFGALPKEQIEQPDTESELTDPCYSDFHIFGVGALPKEQLQDQAYMRTSYARERDKIRRTSDDPRVRPLSGAWSERSQRRGPSGKSYSGGICGPRNNLPSAAIKSWSVFVNQDGLIPSAITTSCTSSRSAESTISRQSRRWSLKVIVLKIRQCCHACGRKETAEDMEMESKQAARLKEKARKKALMSRMENFPAMLNAASSTSATSATRGDKPLQKDTQRIRTSKQAALDKEEETMPRKAERQHLGGKSSSKCVSIGRLCAKLSRKLFPAFR